MTTDEHQMTPDEVVATEINIMSRSRGARAQLRIFYYSATKITSKSTVFGVVTKVYRKSHCFDVKFYVANDAVFGAPFQPPKKSLVPKKIYGVWEQEIKKRL